MFKQITVHEIVVFVYIFQKPTYKICVKILKDGDLLQ